MIRTKDALSDAIAACQTGDPDETTNCVFEKLGVPDEWRTVFHGVVRHACWDHARSLIRPIERGVDPATNENQGGSDNPSLDRASFIKRYTHVNDEIGTVLTDQMTVEHHRLRIEYLEKYKTGIDRTIKWHTLAIEQITAAGVCCLADLEKALS